MSRDRESRRREEMKQGAGGVQAGEREQFLYFEQTFNGSLRGHLGSLGQAPGWPRSHDQVAQGRSNIHTTVNRFNLYL